MNIKADCCVVLSMDVMVKESTFVCPASKYSVALFATVRCRCHWQPGLMCLNYLARSNRHLKCFSPWFTSEIEIEPLATKLPLVTLLPSVTSVTVGVPITAAVRTVNIKADLLCGAIDGCDGEGVNLCLSHLSILPRHLRRCRCMCH